MNQRTGKTSAGVIEPPKAISNEIHTGPLYRSDNNQLQPLPGSDKTVKRQADPGSEYVAGGPFYLAATYLRSLSFAVDDVTSDFGDDLYDRMMLDSQVASDVQTVKMAALAQGVHILPAVRRWETDGATSGGRREHPDWKRAREIADFCERNVAGVTGAFDPSTANSLYWSLYSLLDGIAFGNKVAEKVFHIPAQGPDAGRLCLRMLKVKPRRSVAFVVDPYKNVVGVLALVPGQAMPVLVQSVLGDPDQIPNLLPRRKFAVLTFRPKDADPRGTSILRPVYDPWFVKQQIKQERLKYLARFVGGGILGYTAPEAQQVQALNPDGSPQFDAFGNAIFVVPEAAMLNSLISWQNGAVATFPAGARVEVVFPPVQTPFEEALDRQDREISKAILGTTRATMEARHGSRADSEQGQDVLGLLVQHIKSALETLLRDDVLRDLVEYNFGPEALALLPKVSLSRTESQDFPENATAVAQLQTSGYLASSQLPETDAMLGLPIRTETEQKESGNESRPKESRPKESRAIESRVRAAGVGAL